MSVLVHDYCGHPFQLQLSKSLAHRGNRVTHLSSGEFQTPKATSTHMTVRGLEQRSVCLGEKFRKESLLSRWGQEYRYGLRIAEVITRTAPRVVLSANTPLQAQLLILRACRRVGARFVFWLQDVYSEAVGSILSSKSRLIGALAGASYGRLERRLLRASDHVVAITEDFLPLLRNWGVREEACTVIPNWACLDEMPILEQGNRWSEAHELSGKRCIVYSGTLGKKHNPELLMGLARRFRLKGDVRIVVISEGPVVDALRLEAQEHGLDNMLFLPYQPYDNLPYVLASASVLVGVLTDDAGGFSVPSKVMTYMCARRPILLAAPARNLASRILTMHQAGIVVPPGKPGRFFEAAENLLSQTEAAAQIAANARAYAERAFNIDRITDHFEIVLGLTKPQDDLSPRGLEAGTSGGMEHPEA